MIIQKSVLRYIALSRRDERGLNETRRNRISVLTWKERKALESKLQGLDDLETTLFGVQQKVAKSFLEYGGKTPTADDIIHNAVIWRCLETGKPHLIWPKLAAMFPENYGEGLAHEMSVDRRVRRVTYRIKAGQIVGRTRIL